MSLKKKQRIFFTKKHFYIFFVILLLIIAIFVAYIGKKVESVSKESLSARVEIARQGAAFYTTCARDSNSTDHTLPTIKIVNPQNGSTMPFNGIYDEDKQIYRGVEFKIVAQDDMGFDDMLGNVGSQTKAWVIIDGNDYVGLVPTYYTDTVDSFGVHSLGFYNYDAYKNPKPIGSEIKYQFGVCDAAGNKTLSNVITVTIVK